MRYQHYKQKGMATLLTSVVIVFVISMISIYAAQVSVMEQKISANHYRTVQAFEAAQAGLDTVLLQLTPKLAKYVNKNNTEGIGTLADFEVAGVNIIHQLKDDNGNTLGRFDFSFQQDATDSALINFTVNGYASDNSSKQPNQIIQQKLLFTPTIAYQPPAPLIARQNINVASNDVTITNITGDPGATIWAGGNVVISESNNTCSGMMGCGMGSGSSITVSATINSDESNSISSDNDTQLGGLSPDNFFENFISETRNRIKQKSDIQINCSSGCDTNVLIDIAANPESNIIWVDTFNSTNNSFESLTINNAINLGSIESPVILFVNGILKINHPAASIIGVIYTTHSFDNGNGAGNIIGSLISEGDINIKGNFGLTYDNTAMENLIDNTAKYVRLPGSWRDF